MTCGSGLSCAKEAMLRPALQIVPHRTPLRLITKSLGRIAANNGIVANMNDRVETLVITRTLRVPLAVTPAGDGAGPARQLDAVLMSAGFKLARPLMERLSAMPAGEVLDAGVRVLAVVRRLVGDHIRHNAYFKEFPSNVPDTMEFWVQSLREALLDPAAMVAQAGANSAEFGSLLSLPSYGSYQHSYEAMLAAHDELIPGARDRVTVLHLGSTLDEEAQALYLSLAASTVPLAEEDLASLQVLAEYCAEGAQPEVIAVRENRAVINAVRLEHGRPLLADTVTDILRVAVAVSGGDVTLQESTRFRSFRRPERRAMLAALDKVVSANRAKLSDVTVHSEPWKRLGERLHPHEYQEWPGALEAFAAARGDLRAPTTASVVEAKLAGGDVAGAARTLARSPGALYRSLDRLLRLAGPSLDAEVVLGCAESAAPNVAGRVLMSVRDHLHNRAQPTDVSRVFANRKGRAWVAPDSRDALDPLVVERMNAVIDGEITRRLPDWGRVVIDPAILGVALPLSGKVAPSGLGIMPRGSVSRVNGEVLRFFVYWRQRQRRTDYDLSALMLDENYDNAEHVSWTSFQAGGYATYSGDLTSARDGATEFIDIRLPAVTRRIIIPQVNIYSGEGFDEAEEAFFGFMIRESAQAGAPFEARTVEVKSDLRGSGTVALPLAFMRGDDGRWRAKWLHLYLKGSPRFNQVEGNQVTTSLLARAIIERDYLRVSYLADLFKARGADVESWDGTVPDEPVTFIGFQRPEGLAEGSEAFTLPNLTGLIPE